MVILLVIVNSKCGLRGTDPRRNTDNRPCQVSMDKIDIDIEHNIIIDVIVIGSSIAYGQVLVVKHITSNLRGPEERFKQVIIGQ